MDGATVQHAEISPDEHRPLASSQMAINHPSRNLEGSVLSPSIGTNDESSCASPLPSLKQTSRKANQKYKQKKTKRLAVCMVSVDFDCLTSFIRIHVITLVYLSTD